MAVRKSKTEKWLRSVRNTKIGYFLPSPTEYRKMPADVKRMYTKIMQDYTRPAKVSVYKNRAMYRAIDYAVRPDSEMPTNKRTRIKNLWQRVNDIRRVQNEIDVKRYQKRPVAPRKDPNKWAREKRQYGRSPSKERYQDYLNGQTASIIKKIPKDSFNENNLEIRAAGRLLYGYTPTVNPNLVYLVRAKDNDEVITEYSLGLKDQVDRMIARHNKDVKAGRLGNMKMMAEQDESVIFSNFRKLYLKR